MQYMYAARLIDNFMKPFWWMLDRSCTHTGWSFTTVVFPILSIAFHDLVPTTKKKAKTIVPSCKLGHLCSFIQHLLGLSKFPALQAGYSKLAILHHINVLENFGQSYYLYHHYLLNSHGDQMHS